MEQEIRSVKFAVMRRVHFIHFAQKLFEPRNIKIALLLLFVALESFLVSIPHVLSNLLGVLGSNIGDVHAMYSFVSGAFLNTQLTVQAISLGIFVVIMFFAKDLVRFSFLKRSSI